MKNISSLKKPKQLGYLQSLYVLKQIKLNNLSVLLELGNKNEMTCIRLGTKKILLPSTIELLHGFFNRDQKTIIKTPRAQYHSINAMGEGLITTDNKEWVKKRTQVKGIFSANHMSQLKDVIQHCISDHLKESEGPVILNDLFHSISVSVIGKSIFGEFNKEDGRIVSAQVNKMIEPTFHKMVSPFPFFVDPFNKLITAARKKLFSTLEANIDMSRKSVTDNIIKQYYPQGYCTEDVCNLFVAGYETTSNTLFWLFYELSRNKEVKDKLYNELKEIKDFDSYENLLLQIPYSIACVRETLRLYPPAWIMGRTTTENLNIDNYGVKVNTDVILSPFVFHRLKKYWESPDVFLPARFYKNELHFSDRPYFFPFGIGVRSCIGEKLSLMEIYMVLISVFKNYNFTIEQKEIVFKVHFTLRPSETILIQLNKFRNYGTTQIEVSKS